MAVNLQHFDADFIRDLQEMRQEFRLGKQPGLPTQRLTPPPREIHFTNTHSQTVPAFGVMKITDVDRQHLDFYEITRPDGSGTRFLVNGPRAVANGDRGVAFRFGRALYEDSDGTPAFGEIWGPGTDTWKLRKGNPGFEVQGAPHEESVVVWDVIEPIALAKISGGIIRRASGVCTSATATIWEITAGTLAASSKTITVYNPSGLPITSSELFIAQRTNNGVWIATELCGAMRDFWYHAKLGMTTLASATAITTSTLTGGTVWPTSSAFPVHFSGGQTLCNMPGYYRLHAVLYINSKWTQPDDNIHHWARITFSNYLGGSFSGTALGYANFSYPARRTSTDGSHDHPIPVGAAGDHHHTFDEIGDQYALVVLNGIVTKVGTTTQEISIRPTAIAGSAGGPAIGDFGCATGSIELKPVGYGETLGAWVI